MFRWKRQTKIWEGALRERAELTLDEIKARVKEIRAVELQAYKKK